MRFRLLVGFLVFSALGAPLLAQAGPDNEPAAAQGFANNPFHNPSPDAINLFNGSLTIPIPVGPSYQIGPNLSFQAQLTYNSRVLDFGNPTEGLLGYYRPLRGDPALGIGWTFTLGKIGRCENAFFPPNPPCYLGPDGGQIRFVEDSVVGSTHTYTTRDATQYKLQRTGTSNFVYTMWDGDGNKYIFDRQLRGFDDEPNSGNGYIRDYGLGRDGWYLTSITDPFQNKLEVTYFGAGVNPCPFTCAGITSMLCGSGNIPSWIPQFIKSKPAGGTAQIIGEVVTDPTYERIKELKFHVVHGGVSERVAWTINYNSFEFAGRPDYCDTTVWTISSITLPPDTGYLVSYYFGYFGDSPANDPSGFAYDGLLSYMFLPTEATIYYDYGNYHYYRGRMADLDPENECFPIAPPPGQLVRKSSVQTDDGGRPDLEERPAVPCIGTNRQYTQTQPGVLRRTVTFAALDRTTDYTQYSFPYGEAGGDDAQTVTIVRHPADVDGRRTAETTLFWAGNPDPTDFAIPGQRAGAEIRHAVYNHDLDTATIPLPPTTGLCGSPADALCADNAIRVSQRLFEYSGAEGANRHLKSEKTYYGHITAIDPDAADYCPTCKSHKVEYKLRTPNPGEPAITWEGNGRHYNIEEHSGNLGDDTSRKTTTYWTPQDGPWLRNLYDRRYEEYGGSTVRRYFFFDTTTGFLKGTETWESARQYFMCQYGNLNGTVANQVTLRTLSQPQPPEPPTALPNLCFGAITNYTTIGSSQDLFAKQFTYSGALLASARWMTSPTTTAAWPIEEHVRDAISGWVTSSKDTAGLSTSYLYDSIQRVTKLSPPGEAVHYACYETPFRTIAARSDSTLTCPIARTTPGTLTWQQLDYDGLGNLIRETRRMPNSAYVKRFTQYDGRSTPILESEWVSETTAETGWTTAATTCTADGGNYSTTRPLTAPGTARRCFDPLGRPQEIVGAKHSSRITISRTDGSAPYSDTREAVTTKCLNKTFDASGNCIAGGVDSTTTTVRDAFGRIKSVTEPAGEVTNYAYGLNDKLVSVTPVGSPTPIQPPRTFVYDVSGFLRSESTPEKGTVTYDDYGSLGNLLKKTEGGGSIQSFMYDFAGRLSCQIAGTFQTGNTCDTAGLTRYVRNYYDGTGFPGGAEPEGKLTRQIATNPLFIPLWPTTASAEHLQEDYTYSGIGGRLSEKATRMATGAVDRAVESWTYNTLGLVATHKHPRMRNGTLDPATSRGSLQETITYAAGLPTSVAVSGTDYDNTAVPAVTLSATYYPAGNLASYTATRPGGYTLSTTIEADASGLPRPGQIFSTLALATVFDTGDYTYDAAGNILSMTKDVNNTDTFTYDTRSRLTNASYKVGGITNSQAFTYDRYGNLLSKAGTTLCTTQCTNNRLPSPYAYDVRGNLISTPTDTLTYDVLNRQIKNVNTTAGTWQYLYNGSDERAIRQTAASASAATTRRDIARFITQAKIQAGQWTLTIAGCNEGALDFSDVHCADPDWDYIRTFKEKNITTGCGGGQYCPNAELPREQMAVLLLRAEHGGSYTPPACSGIFTDVPCPSTYANWIEQLAAEGITAGCGPNIFCPTQSVTELEMATFLNKPPLWPTYRGIPGGSTYTLRDEGNRLVTEFADSFAARDNLFLGNVVIASYLPKQPGASSAWHFHAVDHLGSVRYSVNGSTGAFIEAHKYWPYGDEMGTPPSSQRLAFAAMERDTETGITAASNFYDHARTQSARLGRFASPDLIQGFPNDPQSWNRYSYVLSNPLKYTDPLGLFPLWILQKQPAPADCPTGYCERADVDALDPIRRAQRDLIYDLIVRPYFSLITGSNNDPYQLAKDLLQIALNAVPVERFGLAINHLGPLAGRLVTRNFKQAAKALGIDPVRASKAVHAAKAAVGRKGGENVVFDLESGDILAPETGEVLGTLFDFL